MIENKEIGLKFAEDPREEAWSEVQKRAEKTLIDLEIQKEVNDLLIELAKKKLKK